MTREGFQLDPAEIADQIRKDISQPGSHLTTYFDLFAHPDFNTGMTWVHDPVDRAVVVFVGTREEAEAIVSAARLVLKAETAA